MTEKKQKYAYWMHPSMVAEIEEMLFKLAVEVAKSNHLIAATNTISDNVLERLNGKCCKDVALNNGRVTFENAYRYQHGDEN